MLSIILFIDGQRVYKIQKLHTKKRKEKEEDRETGRSFEDPSLSAPTLTYILYFKKITYILFFENKNKETIMFYCFT